MKILRSIFVVISSFYVIYGIDKYENCKVLMLVMLDTCLRIVVCLDHNCDLYLNFWSLLRFAVNVSRNFSVKLCLWVFIQFHLSIGIISCCNLKEWVGLGKFKPTEPSKKSAIRSVSDRSVVIFRNLRIIGKLPVII